MVVAAVASKGEFLAARTPFEAIKPWEAGLQGKDRLSIYRDKTRNLPVTDPHSRQLTIGMGCFLDLMDMAAAQVGIGVETTLYPQDEDGSRRSSRRFRNIRK